MEQGKQIHREKNKPRRNKTYSGHNPKKLRERTENRSNSRNSNDQVICVYIQD